MDELLRSWLDGATRTPSDYYRLLGRPCFYGDQKELTKAIRQANRFLHRYQNHEDRKVVKRARDLQMLIAKAEDIFSDKARWSRYDQQLIQEIQLKWDRRTTGAWHRADLRRWLLSTQDVDPNRVDAIIETFMNSGGSSQLPRSPEGQTADSGAFWKAAFAGPKIQTTIPPAPQSAASQSESASRRPPERPAAGARRPPARNKVSAQRIIDASPVPEPRTGATAGNHSVADAPSNNASYDLRDEETGHGSGGSGMLWIVLSAVGTVFVLGVIALVVFLIVTVK